MSEPPRSGFLHRWSRRKIDAREGHRIDEPAAPTAPDHASPVERTEAAPPSPGAAAAERSAEPALPTLDDVRALTSDSDFSPFVSRSVTPDVKNAALKKLFSDPHYNVMDGLDIYIDDYSQQAPIPESMLRKMAVSKVFGFFEDEAPDAVQPKVPQSTQADVPADADPRDVPDAVDTPSATLPRPAAAPETPALTTLTVPSPHDVMPALPDAVLAPAVRQPLARAEPVTQSAAPQKPTPTSALPTAATPDSVPATRKDHDDSDL